MTFSRRLIRRGGRAPHGVLACTVLAALGLSGAAPAKPLAAAVAELVRTHPRILAAERRVGAAREGARAADAGFLPAVSLSGDIGHERVDSVERRRTAGTPSRLQRDALTLSVTQTLFDGHETPTRSRIGALGTDAAQAGLASVRQTVLFAGIEAYLSVLRERRVLDIARQTERTLETQLALEEERLRQGGGLLVDVLQTRTRLQLARERRAATRGLLEAAVTRYGELFDEPPELDAMAVPPTAAGALPGTVGDAVAQARRNNPALARSRAEVDIAAERRTLARAAYYPDLDLVVEGSWESDVEGINGIRREQRVLLRGRWDLFDGFRRDAEAARAVELYGARRDTHASLAREVESRIRRAWSALETARRTADYLREAAGTAREVFAARRKLRREGRETLINVLDAEQDLNAARRRLVRAEFDARLAVYRVLLNTGGLERAALGAAAP